MRSQQKQTIRNPDQPNPKKIKLKKKTLEQSEKNHCKFTIVIQSDYENKTTLIFATTISLPALAIAP
jgi:hypothetical protein